MIARLVTQLIILFIVLPSYASKAPASFVYLNDIDPTIIQEIKYYSTDNFIGRQVKGYDAPKCILTYEAALALSKLQKQLRPHGIGIKVYDCYRPSMAVDDFINWSHNIQDQQQKKNYYPKVNKADFFKLGYVANKSGHSRGSTVDMTFVRLEKNRAVSEFNMGTHFDYMDEYSHPLNKKIATSIQHNRLFLRTTMMSAGFTPIETEWWHFTLKNERFSNTYFNFPVA